MIESTGTGGLLCRVVTVAIVILLGAVAPMWADPNIAVSLGGHPCAATTVGYNGLCTNRTDAKTIDFNTITPFGSTPASPYVIPVDTVPPDTVTMTWNSDLSPFVQGTKSGNWAMPAYTDSVTNNPVYDQSVYVTVGSPKQGTATMPQSVTFDFLPYVSYIGFHLGSADTYNALDIFLYDSQNPTVPTAHLTGKDLFVPTTGDQAKGAFVNLDINGAANRMTVTSSQAAFEFDNLAIAPVPEPSSMMLLGTAFLGLFGVLRKKISRV